METINDGNSPLFVFADNPSAEVGNTEDNSDGLPVKRSSLVRVFLKGDGCWEGELAWKGIKGGKRKGGEKGVGEGVGESVGVEGRVGARESADVDVGEDVGCTLLPLPNATKIGCIFP